MLSAEESDQVIWERFRNGDRGAFEILIRTHYRSLFSYGQRFEKNGDLVKDCIHDLFAHLWQHRQNLSATDTIKPYLLTSLRNRIFKQKRRDTPYDLADAGVSDHLLYTGSVQDDIIASEEALLTQRKVEHLLKALTPRQQEIIYLRFFQDLSNEQIAGLMHITKPAVANLLHASLKLLREKWMTLIAILNFLIN